ncbi:hypothetical protein NXS19_011161 [Fusarium pseudograminearum]|nr:hypothetical protein NXS19_011161 [Fusarium pseudograminearum]
MSRASCPVSGSIGASCPASRSSRGSRSHSRSQSQRRGCAFSGASQPGDLHAAFDIPRGVDPDDWLRTRERKSINELLYKSFPSRETLDRAKTQPELDALNASDQSILATALGAPGRQVLRRAEDWTPHWLA